jgi:hypothetical protein
MEGKGRRGGVSQESPRVGLRPDTCPAARRTNREPTAAASRYVGDTPGHGARLPGQSTKLPSPAFRFRRRRRSVWHCAPTIAAIQPGHRPNARPAGDPEVSDGGQHLLRFPAAAVRRSSRSDGGNPSGVSSALPADAGHGTLCRRLVARTSSSDAGTTGARWRSCAAVPPSLRFADARPSTVFDDARTDPGRDAGASRRSPSANASILDDI